MWHDSQQVKHVPIQRPLARHRVLLSRRVIAYYGLIRASESLPATYEFEGRVLHPRKSASGGNPEGPQFTPLDCARVPPPIPGGPKSAIDCFFLFGIAFTLVSRVRRPHWKFRGCRVHLSHKKTIGIVTARELASPPFEDVYIRAFADEVTLNQRRI